MLYWGRYVGLHKQFLMRFLWNFFFLSIICLINSFNLSEIFCNLEYVWFVTFLYPIFTIWLISSLAETNRSPFDFAEGESELVSGFNVEYRRGGFALLFLAEYASIVFIRYFIVLMFMEGGLKNIILFNILIMFFLFCFYLDTRNLPSFTVR